MSEEHFENIKIIVRENIDMPFPDRSSVGIKYTVNGKIEGLFLGYDKPTLTVAEIVEAVNKLLNKILCERRQTTSEDQQINEMALAICKSRGVAEVDDCGKCGRYADCLYYEIACGLYKADYRRQSKGEWIQQLRPYEDEIMCSVCGANFNVIDNCTEKFDFCPNCGASMKGGAE